MPDNEIKTEIAKLKSKKLELIKRLEDIESDYKQGLSADSEEQAIQLENAEVLEGIAKATSEELENIKKQIAELEE
jgi:hypothetical protein